MNDDCWMGITLLAAASGKLWKESRLVKESVAARAGEMSSLALCAKSKFTGARVSAVVEAGRVEYWFLEEVCRGLS